MSDLVAILTEKLSAAESERYSLRSRLADEVASHDKTREIQTAAQIRVLMLEERLAAAEQSNKETVARYIQAATQRDEAWRRLADKEILLAEAAEYGTGYKQARDEALGNYQAALSRLSAAEALIKSAQFAVAIAITYSDKPEAKDHYRKMLADNDAFLAEKQP